MLSNIMLGILLGVVVILLVSPFWIFYISKWSAKGKISAHRESLKSNCKENEK